MSGLFQHWFARAGSLRLGSARKQSRANRRRPKISSTTPTRCFTVPATGIATRSSKIDFPRLAVDRDLELFRDLARLGGELVGLHLLESPKLDQSITTYAGPKNPEVAKVGWSERARLARRRRNEEGPVCLRPRHYRLPRACPRTSGTSASAATSLREMAQGSQRPHAREGRRQPLPEDRRRAPRTIRLMKGIDVIIEKTWWNGLGRSQPLKAISRRRLYEGTADSFP